jgi:hypothetical protein
MNESPKNSDLIKRLFHDEHEDYDEDKVKETLSPQMASPMPTQLLSTQM